MSDIKKRTEDMFFNHNDMYECFLCKSKFKTSGAFIYHTLTDRHDQKMTRLGMDYDDLELTCSIYERIINLYGKRAVDRYIMYANNDSKNKEVLLSYLNEESKNYKLLEFGNMQAWSNRLNNYTNYRFKSFSIININTNDILYITHENVFSVADFFNNKTDRYTFYKNIEDLELKLIADIVFRPCIIYPRKYNNSYTKLNTQINKNIATHEKDKYKRKNSIADLIQRKKRRNILLYECPWWYRDIGRVIDSYL